MQSDDKRYLGQMLATLKSYRTSTNMPLCANPIDDEVFESLVEIESKLTEDAFDIFRFKKPLLQLWKKLIEKSIVCLRYFDTREPFGKPDVKKAPYAYGVQNLYEYFEKYNEFENLLYGGSEYYRDHVIHVIRVWIIGTDILLRDKAKFIQAIEIVRGFKFSDLEKLSIWTIIAMSHDLGYPLEKSMKIMDKTKDMMKCFIQNPILSMDFSFSGVQNLMNDFVIRFMSSKMWRVRDRGTIAIESEPGADEKDKDYFVARLQPKFYFKFQKSLEQNNHGILSSLLIYKMLLYFLESDYSTNEDYVFDEEDTRQFYMRREILRSISSHTCQDIYQLHLYSFSLLLIIADDAQEWGRKQISELYVQKDTGYEFKGIDIVDAEASDGNTCIMTEQYTISNKKQFKHILKQFRRISLGYNAWFRDGQDTDKRDFNFVKITKVVVKMGGSDKDVELSLHINKREASYFDIKLDTARCKECGLEEIVLQLFGEPKEPKEAKVAKSGSYIYNVVDVEQFVEECKEKKDN